MKKVWGGAIIGLALLALIASVLMRKPVPARIMPSQANPTSASETAKPRSNLIAIARDFGVRMSVLSPEEKTALERKFTTQMKPAMERWCKAYDGRLSIKTEDLTLEKFKEEIGRNASFTIYTFVVDGTTLCFRDSGGQVVVNYLFTPEAKQLTQLRRGTAPSLKLPVSRDEIISMVKADSGAEFRLDQILLTPTGVANAVNGGAFVDVAPLGGDPNNGLSKLSIVFNSDGKMVAYDRDPTL
jgi:hypothetical protein